MRDALKIGLGIVIGALALIGLCTVCALIAAFGLSAGLVGSLGTPTPAGIVPPAFGTSPVPAETMSPMGTGVQVDDLRITPPGIPLWRSVSHPLGIPGGAASWGEIPVGPDHSRERGGERGGGALSF